MNSSLVCLGAVFGSGLYVHSGSVAWAVVLEAVSFRARRRKRKDRIEPVQCLDCGLLIDTESRSMLRRIHIQPDDVCRLAVQSADHCWPCTAPADAVAV